MKLAFISSHQPTPEHINVAAQKGYELVYVGCVDEFEVTPDWLAARGEFDGAVVTHPACDLNLISEYLVGVFQNEIFAPFGQPAQFLAKTLHFWDPCRPYEKYWW